MLSGGFNLSLNPPDDTPTYATAARESLAGASKPESGDTLSAVPALTTYSVVDGDPAGTRVALLSRAPAFRCAGPIATGVSDLAAVSKLENDLDAEAAFGQGA